MKLPIKHLSARVPWHDNKWNGTICKNPCDNSFCRVLPGIDAQKDVDTETTMCGEKFCDLKSLPPCVSEKGGFLSPFEYNRQTIHSYHSFGNKLFSEFMPAIIVHKPYSINAVPFRWMLKDQNTQASEMANTYNLDYDPQKEEDICVPLGFRPNWVQHRDNQRELLNSFFGCLEPKKSLIFFYAKHTPFSETNVRAIVGAAYVNFVGDIIDYKYPDNYKGHRSYVWDRMIGHSLVCPDDGCILPYHELIEYESQNPDNSVLCRDCIVEAPDYEQFSHASELVENDTAIDALFAMQASLMKASKILKIDFSNQLAWLDNAVSQVWNMRGAFPSMGSVLTASSFENGNAIAWQIDQYITDTYGDIYGANAWDILDQLIQGKFTLPAIKITKTIQTQWNRSFSDKQKEKMKLLSRVQMNIEQAKFALELENVLENPYSVFEESRRAETQISFNSIDKAVYPVKIIEEKFPITETNPFDDNLDQRRIRALVVHILENFSDIGNTLMTEGDLINSISEMVLTRPVPVTTKLLESYCCDAFFDSFINRIQSDDNGTTIVFYKLLRLEKVKEAILTRFNFSIIEKRTLSCTANFREYLDAAIGAPFDPTNKTDEQSREEKENAMEVLAKYRVSVLVGPAGSGKTTLLKAFCAIPEIKIKGIVMLAPTGKARVNMSEKAETVAQFLYRLNRYDIFTGQYRLNPTAAKTTCGTLIVDEASMLTEEQLAAILDATTYERLILVGDYRQLPPIGAGRPFFDIVQKLKPTSGKTGTAYAELTSISRQQTDDGKQRNDVLLSRYYGNAEKFDYEGIFELIDNINNNSANNIELVRWDTTDDLKKEIMSCICKDLQLDDQDLVGTFADKALGRVEGKYYNFDSSEKVIEDWQILSPVNGHAHGVKEINKYIQLSFRKDTIEWANRKFSSIPAPMGRDNFVYGDKVINLGNRKMKENSVYNPKHKQALNYIANGEIGSVVGHLKKGSKPNVWIAFTSQQGYVYSFYQSQFDEGEKSFEFELAYCISVHKSQGSGFKKVFLILPANNPMLSRELLYTALTRQKEKIVILHQGEFVNYLKYAADEYSETARRLTNLFHMPSIKEYHNKSYDSRYVNITRKGEAVISKSEALIANILYDYEQQGKLTYSYESKLELSTGRTIKPDFTIEDIATGRKFYWEHLGLLDSIEYKSKWELKRQAYLSDGVVLAENATIEDDVILITTEDSPQGGINSQSIDDKVKQFIFNY